MIATTDCPDDESVLAFLDRQMVGPRAVQLEAHIDTCPSCRRLVGVLAQDLLDRTSPVRMGLLQKGDRVDHFLIEGLIGRGGMGDVYAAEDTTLKRTVAIKLINAALSESSEARARILVEARAMARLGHPNIAAIHAAGEHGDRPYLALEHLEGATLRQRLDQGPIEIADAIAIGRAIAAALAEAHAHGVLHRDLKPQNVMLPRDGRPRVLDFGLAKVQPGELDPRGDSLFETQDPTIRGTPAYISPEQWRGEKATEAADVWALGVILYELASGRRPYQEVNAISYAVRVAEPQPVPPPSARPGTPERFIQLVGSCLEKDPAKRPKARDLANALGEIGAGDAVRVAKDLEAAAQRWMSHGETARDLWDGAVLTRAERALADSAVSLAAPATRFLSASVEQARLRAKRRGKALVLLGVAATGAAVLAAVMAVSSQRQAERAERGESEATRQRATALIEGASAAMARGENLEARAKLRQGLELGDSAAGRALWSTLERDPRLWSRTLGSGLFDAVISPSGDQIAAGAQDRTVYLVDTQTLATRSLRGHRDQVYKVAYAPDGKQLASGSWSGEIRVWTLPEGGSRTLQASGARPSALVFDPDGSTLFAASIDGPIRALPLGGGEPRIVSDKSARDLAFDEEGLLWAAHQDGHARAYDRNKMVLDLAAADVPATAIAVSADEIAVGCDDGRVRVLTRKGELKRTLEGHRSKIVRVRFASNGRVVSIAEDRSARLWLPDNSVLLLGDSERAVWGLDVDPTGQRAVIAGVEGKLHYVDLARKEASTAGGSHHDGATSVVFADGVLYSGGYDRTIRTWDVRDGTPLGAMLGHQGTIYGLARRDDMLASASHDGTVRLWRIPSGVESALLSGHQGGVYAVTFDRDGRTLATAGVDSTVRRWALPSGTAGVVERTHEGAVFALAWSPSGDRLASGGVDKIIHITDAKGRVVQRLVGHEASIWGLAFHPQKPQQLVSASYDGTLRLWDLKKSTSRVIARLEARAYAVAFLPDGERVVASSADGRAYVFRLASGEKIELRGHRAEVNQVRVDGEGKLAATASDDGTVRVWDVATGWPTWRSSADARITEKRGKWSCKITLAGDLELWDGDTRMYKAEAIAATSLRALDGACLTLEGGPGARAARLFDRNGSGTQLAASASAIETDCCGKILIATDDRLLGFDEAGHSTSERPIDRGVTAVVPLGGGRFGLGYDNGRIDLVGESEPMALEATPGGATVRLVAGPMRTLLAGWDNGEIGLFSLDNGARLLRAELHGPIVALASDGEVITAASELGQKLRPIDVYAREYCALMREIWAAVPVVWKEGLPAVRPPPEVHACASR